MAQEPKLIATVPRSATEQMQISINEYKGKSYLDLRIHYTTDDGQTWLPTKKGVTCSPENLEILRDAIDEAIKEYADADIETAYTGDKYLKGFSPKPSNEYQSKQREQAYIAEVDPITAHISRLKDETQTPDVVEEIEKLKIERAAKRAEIKERFPYYEQE